MDTSNINEAILRQLETEERTYYSVNSFAHSRDTEDIWNAPTEFLNTLIPSCFLTHRLTQKVGCVAMILPNMNISRGLVNGTRLSVDRLNQNHIEAKVFTCSSAGETVFESVSNDRIKSDNFFCS